MQFNGWGCKKVYNLNLDVKNAFATRSHTEEQWLEMHFIGKMY
jgi:hypothetical protein